jgi:type II secretory pathway pseudopilin PulG
MSTVLRRFEAGFTLVEMLVGAGIMVAVGAACIGGQLAATNLMNESAALGALEEQAIIAVKQVAFDARWADGGAMLLTTSNGSRQIDLRTAVDLVGGNPVWSPTVTWRVVPSSSDSNGNGIVDEGQLVRIQDGVTRVICDDVVPSGFTATRTGDTLEIQVRLLRVQSGRPVTVSAATSATIRN